MFSRVSVTEVESQWTHTLLHNYTWRCNLSNDFLSSSIHFFVSQLSKIVGLESVYYYSVASWREGDRWSPVWQNWPSQWTHCLPQWQKWLDSSVPVPEAGMDVTASHVCSHLSTGESIFHWSMLSSGWSKRVCWNCPPDRNPITVSTTSNVCVATWRGNSVV